MIVELKRYFILILTLLVMGSFAYLCKEKNQHQQDIQDFKAFVEEANKLKVLKDQWSNKDEDKKFLAQIQSRFAPTSYAQKGNTYILDFENLDKISLSKLGRMLMNSNLTIKSMDFEKHEANVSVHVEIII